MRYFKGWTTHMPMLIKFVQTTNKPVLELGTGPFSTPLLHWLCKMGGNKLVSLESDEWYYKRAKRFQSRNHGIYFVDDWDKVGFEKKPDRYWGVVLVDHELERRKPDPIRLKDKADFLVMHDTSQANYGYAHVFPHFKYVYHWRKDKPWTSVVSNFIDPNESI